MWFQKFYASLYFKYVVRVLSNSNILCAMNFNIYINYLII